MSDVVVTLKIPEKLANDAAHLGLLSSEHLVALLQNEVTQRSMMTYEAPRNLKEQEEDLVQLLPPEHLEEGLRLLREGKPIPGLFAGKIAMSEDFDDALTDEEWGDLFR